MDKRGCAVRWCCHHERCGVYAFAWPHIYGRCSSSQAKSEAGRFVTPGWMSIPLRLLPTRTMRFASANGPPSLKVSAGSAPWWESSPHLGVGIDDERHCADDGDPERDEEEAIPGCADQTLRQVSASISSREDEPSDSGNCERQHTGCARIQDEAEGLPRPDVLACRNPPSRRSREGDRPADDRRRAEEHRQQKCEKGDNDPFSDCSCHSPVCLSGRCVVTAAPALTTCIPTQSRITANSSSASARGHPSSLQ
jgi:hypothetical protein